MNVRHRLRAVATREAKKFIAVLAARQATRSVGTYATPSFRPLTEAETEALLRPELQARLRRPRGYLRD